MKNTKTTKPRNTTPKPDAAPDPYTAVMLFKSGETLKLQFLRKGYPDGDALLKFKDDYIAWATNAPGRKPGNCYIVCSWGSDQTPPEHEQSVIIMWDTVQAVSYSR